MDATTTTPSWDRTRRDANTDSAPSTRGVRGKPTSIHACLNVLVFAVFRGDRQAARLARAKRGDHIAQAAGIALVYLEDGDIEEATLDEPLGAKTTPTAKLVPCATTRRGSIQLNAASAL